MKNDYIHKLERVLYFVRTFHERGGELKRIPNGSKELMITDNLKIAEQFYDPETRILLYVREINSGYVNNSSEHILKTYPIGYTGDGACVELENTFFNDDYYSQFLLFNDRSTHVVFTTGYGHDVSIDIPDIDLQSTEGLFQFQTLHPDVIIDTMQVVQYFKRKGHPSFADWFHPDLDKIYEELNEHYDIGREDYLLSDGIS